MKVLTVGSDRNIFVEGSEVRERIAGYGAIADEYHIIVFSLKKHQLSKVQLAPNVWAYPTSSRARLLYVRDAVHLGLSLGRFDVVSTQDPFECGLTGMFIAKKTRAGLHVQVHTDPFSPFFTKKSPLNYLRLMIARTVLPRADGIRVVSERIKKSLSVARLALKTTPDVLPVFIDADALRHTQLAFSLQEKYPQFDSTILIVSRLTAEKRIDLAIRMVKELSALHQNIGLIIVGDGPLRMELAREAARLGIANRVIFEGWQRDLVSYYKTASVYLLTSDYEGYSRTVIEAAIVGIPIVMTDVGIAGEYVCNEHEALVCPVGDVTCIEKNIARLIDDKALRIKLASNAQSSVATYLLTFDTYLVRMKAQFANSIQKS